MGGGGGYAQIGSNVLGGGGSVISGIMAKRAAQIAGDKQANALRKIQARLEKDLDPAVIAEMARAQDVKRAQDRLALQAQIDPELAAQRQVSQQLLSQQLGEIGASPSDAVAALAAVEGAKGVPRMDEAKAGLIDAALTELKLGATLPPDVQAELMQAGLQKAGQVTGASTVRPGSAGTNILNEVLGTAALKLRAERQTQAAALSTAAGNLEAQRQQILQNLFPALQKQQLQNIAATSGILQQSNQMVPQAGLSGSDVANLWLQKVGALNQISLQQMQSDVARHLAVSQAQQNIWGSVASVGQWKGSGQGAGGAGGTGIDYTKFFNAGGGGNQSELGGMDPIMNVAASGGGNYQGWAVPAVS